MKKNILFVLVCVISVACAKKASVSSVSSIEHNVSTKDYAEPPHIDLINARWVLRELNGKSVPSQADVFIRFKDSTSVEGFGGCNRLFGSYTSKGSILNIGPLASTKMSCVEDHLEPQFLQVLEKAESYYTDSKYLYLQSNGKIIAKLEALYL